MVLSSMSSTKEALFAGLRLMRRIENWDTKSFRLISIVLSQQTSARVSVEERVGRASCVVSVLVSRQLPTSSPRKRGVG